MLSLQSVGGHGVVGDNVIVGRVCVVARAHYWFIIRWGETRFKWYSSTHGCTTQQGTYATTYAYLSLYTLNPYIFLSVSRGVNIWIGASFYEIFKSHNASEMCLWTRPPRCDEVYAACYGSHAAATVAATCKP